MQVTKGGAGQSQKRETSDEPGSTLVVPGSTGRESPGPWTGNISSHITNSFLSISSHSFILQVHMCQTLLQDLRFAGEQNRCVSIVFISIFNFILGCVVIRKYVPPPLLGCKVSSAPCCIPSTYHGTCVRVPLDEYSLIV